jgi:hypothetical protein
MTLLDGKPLKIFIAFVSGHSPGDQPEFPTHFHTAMKFRLFTGFAAALCLLSASCYPYNENPQKKKASQPPVKTATTAERDKLKEQEAQKKKQEEELKKTPQPEPAAATETPAETTAPAETTPKPPAADKRTDYAFANKVPGKDGFVFSPYNNKVVDVRDIPSGTLVQDPTYPASEKKYFRVP